MTPDDLEVLIADGEDSRMDRKRSLRVDTPWHRAEFARDVMAFANGHDRRPAFIVIGVDEQGHLHDVTNALPDEATLQQIVSSCIDPPIQFSLTVVTLHGLRLGVIQIEPSAARFHMASRDIYGEKQQPLLRQGEILIRRGTSKTPPRPLDFQWLKEDYARQLTPRPELAVRFAGNAEECIPAPSRPTANHLFERTLGHLIIPSRLGAPYYLLPVRFFVHNVGQAQAETLLAQVVFPEECQVLLQTNDEYRWPNWSVKVQRSGNAVYIRGGPLVQGDYHSPGYVSVRFPRRNQVYVLRWSASAGNSAAKMTGVLRIQVKAQ